MKFIPIILYFVGVIGIAISIVLILHAIKSNKKPFNIAISIILILSLVFLSGGTIFLLMNKSTPATAAQIEANAEPEPIETKSPSYDDLSFSYKFSSPDNIVKKSATITLRNSSNSIFSGKVNLNFLNSSNEVTNSLEIPVKNLMPHTYYEPKATINSDAQDVNYNFVGSFSESVNLDDSSYKVNKLIVSDDYIRFDVTCEDTSKENLQKICDEFKNEYNSELCDAFLIYFYENGNSKKDFTNAIADFYSNNISDKSKLYLY